MNPRLLLIAGPNVMVSSDADAICSLLVDDFEITHYDPWMVAEVPQFDSVLICPLDTGLSMRELSEVVSIARPGRIFLFECDIQFGRQVPRPLREVPVTIIGSLDPAIKGTVDDAEMRRRWMRHLHRDSELVYIPWLIGLVNTYGPTMETLVESIEADDADLPDVRMFYWGINRPAARDSLAGLGLGQSPNDAVWGRVARDFPRVRNLAIGLPHDDQFDPKRWGELAMAAEVVPVPYEPIKSEWQVTRRLLEIAFLAGERALFDPRVSDEVRRFANLDQWLTELPNVRKLLVDTLTPPPNPWPHFGPQLGSRHGDLLDALLADIGSPNGWAVEFGTGDGTSARKMVAAGLRVMTFDCFDGLPEKWRDGFEAGSFAQRSVPKIPGATVVQGLFSDTLPGHPLPEWVALLHIDCDLYAGTVDVFNRARDLISVGTVILFDELIAYPGWEDHEAKAWIELRRLWPELEVERIGWAHEAVAFRVTRTH